MYDLKGKAALVTGAGRESGIGHALAFRLAGEGADVAVSDICKTKDESDPNWKGLNELVKKIEKLGRSAAAVPADISDTQQVDAMVKEAADRLGGLDIACNNAGAAFAINLSYMIDPADWRRMLDINLTGTFLVSRAAAKFMVKQKRGGSIINTASWRGRYPAPFMAAYCVVKAGIISLTEVMALELAANNIRVNAVCPGKVETDMERSGWQLKADAYGKNLDEIKEEEQKKIPLGRIAVPDDIANVVAFLASDQSSYMTGQAICVTGGLTLVNTA
ncbi:MAG: SDR family NAD(P)-dependent oxidoreductase [bacterium]